MAYKRYVKINGKRFGPYYYESYRDKSGKAKTRYITKPPEYNEKRNVNDDSFRIVGGRVLLILLIIGLVMLVLFFALERNNSLVKVVRKSEIDRHGGLTGLAIDRFFDDPITEEAVTGRAVTENLGGAYELGETISGSIDLNLKDGELIPKDTLVKIKLGSLDREFVLSEFVDFDSVIGKFYAEGSSISGSGEGYGVAGEKKIYESVDFDLEIFEAPLDTPKEIVGREESGFSGGSGSSDSEESGETEEESGGDPEESKIEGGVEEEESKKIEDDKNLGEENNSGEGTGEDIEVVEGEDDSGEKEVEEVVVEEESDEDSGGDLSITGEVISEGEYVVSGSVTNGEDYSYNLEDDQDARILSGSVKVNGKSVSDDSVTLNRESDKVYVSTDYHTSEFGFGEEFLGESGALIFRIDVDGLELGAASGDLKVSLVYGGVEIVSFEKVVVVGDVVGNETVENETLQEIILNESKTNVSVTNASSNLVLLLDIPTIRIPFGGSVIVDLGNYIAGAETYSLDVPNISATFDVDLVKLTPDVGFKGARKASFIAYSGNKSIESNEFLILVSSGAVDIKTKRKKIKVGEPVKWTKNISLEKPENISIQIPNNSSNISILTQDVMVVGGIGPSSVLTGNVVVDINLKKKRPNIFSRSWTWLKKKGKDFKISGKVINVGAGSTGVEVVLNDPESTSYIVEYETPAPEKVEVEEEDKKFVTVSGPEDVVYTDVIAFSELDNTVPVSKQDKIKLYWHNYEFEEKSESEIQETATTTPEEIFEEEIISEESVGEVIGVNSVTIVESNITNETIIVRSESNITNQGENNSSNLTIVEGGSIIIGNVISEFRNESISSIGGMNNESNSSSGNIVVGNTVESGGFIRQEILFDAYDLDSDGNIDYLEWVVPHLSNQTYEIIIEISKAEHLDSNRSFISDIYPEVKAQDENWSETISDGDYVRVVFERNLTNINDITIYPRIVAGIPKIEVYEINGTELISKFVNLIDNEYNKVYLDGSSGSGLGNRGQDTFDLLILNGSLEFDHIIDPTNNTLDTCGTLDQADTIYNLQNDVSTIGTCFTISANNVTLDGQGHLVNYSSLSTGYGIYNPRFNDTTIKNITIEGGVAVGGSYGIYFIGSNNGTIENTYVRTYGDSAHGIYFINSSDNNISSSTVNISGSNEYGLYLSDSSDNSMDYLTVVASGGLAYGIVLGSSSSNNAITYPDITTSGNSGYGIDISGSFNNSITHPVIITSGGLAYGISFSFSSGNVINQGNVDSNSADSIHLAGASSDNNNFTNITITNGGGYYDINFFAGGMDGNYLIDIPHIGNYSFNNNVIYFKDSDFGEIKFLEGINGTGTNLTNDIRIGNNSVVVESGNNIGLNVSANVTLYGVGERGFGVPSILKDGVSCGGLCSNFTALNAQTVEFNVTSWTNYSIGEGDSTPPSVILNAPANASSLDINVFDRVLNSTVSDNGGMALNVLVYGVNSTSTGNFYSNGLLYQELGVSSDSEVTYNWTSPVIVPDSSTVLLMHMDNNSNYGENDTFVYDFSGNENNGTISGAIPNMSGGKFAGGIYFNGQANKFITIADGGTSLDFDNTKNYTFSVWIYRHKSFLYSPIFRKGVYASSGYEWTIYNDKLSFENYGGTGVSGTITIGTNQWYHIATTYSNGEVIHYVNGAKDINGSDTYVSDTTGGLYVSNDGLGWSNATYDEMAIWNRTLSANEIKDLYRLNVDKYFWKVNVTDSVGNNNESEMREFYLNDSSKLTNCGTLDIAGLTYTLQNDVSSAGTCFTIGANNVTLDGQGYLINYSTLSMGQGIYNYKFNGTIIKNIALVQESANLYSYGILFNAVNNGSIENTNVTTSSDRSYGIYLASSDSNTITNSSVSTKGLYGYGIRIDSSSNNNLVSPEITTIKNRSYAIYIVSSSSNNIVSNPNVTTEGNRSYGIRISSSPSNNITSPIVTTSGDNGYGIYLSSSSSNTISNPNVTTSGLYGYGVFFSSSSSGNLVTAPIIKTSGTYGHGVHVGASGNSIVGGSINTSSADNIYIFDSVSDNNNFTNISLFGNNASVYDINIINSSIDRTYLIDIPHIGNYSFNNNVIYFKDSDFGEIKFLEGINGTGTNLTNDIRIGNNSVVVESGNNIGLNVSANVTLYGVGERGFGVPSILKDGVSCGASCSNFTALNAQTVEFNVTSWTNYSVGDETILPSIILNFPVNTTSFDIDVFNITLNASVYDDTPGDLVDVFIYGVNSSETGNFYQHGLLYQKLGVSNNTEVIYNWTAPVVVPDSDTVMLMHMDNNSAYGENDSLVYDFSGNGNNGTSVGNAVPNMSGGKLAGGWEFDGGGDYIAVSSLDDTTFNFTIAGWVKTTDSNGDFVGDWKTTAGFPESYGGWRVGTTSAKGDGLTITIGCGSGCTKITASAGTINDGVWHYFAASYDNSTRIPRVYLDGVEKNGSEANMSVVSARTFKIGFSNSYLNGTIDELALWNRTLSASEVKNLYRLDYGKYFWKVNVTDISGNNNESEIREFSVSDLTAPTVNYVSPSENNGAFRSRGYIEINVTASDNNLDKIKIRLYNSTQDEINSSATSSPNYINFSGLGEGIYYYNATANDTYGNINETATRNITLDTTSPLVTLNFPVNMTYNLSSLPLNFNVTLNERGSVVYSLDGGVNNATMSSSDNLNFNASNGSLTDSSYTFSVYANDTAGNNNYTESVVFSVNAIIPYSKLNSPVNDSTFEEGIFNITLNASVYDDTPGDLVDVFIYGVNSSETGNFYQHGLLYQKLGVSNNTEVIYNWTAPVVVPDSDTVMLMHMDNNSAYGENDSLVYDFSGNGNNGSVTGSIINVSGGKFAGGFEFDSGDEINVGNDNSLSLSSSMTIALWMKPESSAIGEYLVHKASGSAGFGFYNSYTNNRLEFSDGTGSAVSDNNVWSANTWSHVAVSVNSTTVTFYSNGVAVGSDVGTHDISTNTGSLVIGAHPTIGGAGFNGTLDEVAIWNRTLSANEIKDLYRLNVDKYFWKVNVTDSGGNSNESETRVFNVQESVVPLVSYGVGTENDNEVSDSGNIYVNVSVTEVNEDVITFVLYNATGEVNSTTFGDGTRTINWSGLSDGTYTYNVSVNDTSGNSNTTATQTITLVSSCLNQCSEGGDCSINSDCVLHNGLCSGGVCDFDDMSIGATLYTLYNGSGEGRDLVLNVSNVTFTLDNTNFIFSGRNGSTIGDGGRGGNAGTVNITVPWLFNTTNAQFVGLGGYSTLSGVSGGNGGVLQLNYHGLIRNFTDLLFDPFVSDDNRPILTGGSSIGGTSGGDGTITLKRDSKTPRDVDVNGDGVIIDTDIIAIKQKYGNVSSDSNFTTRRDINNDGKINVIDLSMVGFKYETRGVPL